MDGFSGISMLFLFVYPVFCHGGHFFASSFLNCLFEITCTYSDPSIRRGSASSRSLLYENTLQIAWKNAVLKLPDKFYWIYQIIGFSYNRTLVPDVGYAWHVMYNAPALFTTQNSLS
jgi:hypothetical protein